MSSSADARQESVADIDMPDPAAQPDVPAGFERLNLAAAQARPEEALKELLDTAVNATSDATADATSASADSDRPSSEKTTSDPRTERWITISASALMCIIGLNSGWVGPSLASIAKAQGVPLANAGSLVSVYFFGCVVTIVVGQWILEKFGGRNSLRLAALGMLIGLAMIASGAGVVITWLGSFIFGLGVGISSIASNICILAIAASHAASRLNRLHLFFGIGALIGPFFAWAGHQTPWSYQATYAFGVLYTAAVGAILMKAPNIAISVNGESGTSTGSGEGNSSTVAGEGSASPKTLSEQGSIFREPLLWLFSLVLCLYVGIETGAGAWMCTYVEKEFQLSAGASAIVMSCLWGGLTFGRMSGVPLTRRFRPELITLVAMLISTAAFATLVVASNLSSMSLLVVALLGFGFGPIFPTVIGEATTRFPAATGTVTTTLITAGFVGGIIGPWITGAVFEWVGLVPGMTLLLVTCLAMAALYAFCSHNRFSSLTR